MPRPSDPHARVRLLAAARKTFVEKGLDRAKVEDITRAAGMSKGAFYLHFLSKTELFKELVEAFVARLAALTDAGLERCAASPAQDAETLLDQWVSVDVECFDFLWQNRGLLRLLLDVRPGSLHPVRDDPGA